jgi:hypothetical protein
VSHLREVSNGSSEAYDSRPTTASDTGTVQYDPAPSPLPVERKCMLWVHDEGFSKEEVVLNLDLFPDIKPGDLVAIIALKSDSSARDLQEKAHGVKRDAETLTSSIQWERNTSHPRSPGPNGGGHAKHHADLGNRYLFIAKDMPKDIKSKQPSLEISVAKQIADVFCLKHRSNALLTTVRKLNPLGHERLANQQSR